MSLTDPGRVRRAKFAKLVSNEKRASVVLVGAFDGLMCLVLG